MRSDPKAGGSEAWDTGLLSPVTVGSDGLVSDAAVLTALIRVEIALVRAWSRVGAAPQELRSWSPLVEIPVEQIAAAGAAGGNPVIPLVPALRERVEEPARSWVHRGATSQDILDTAMMVIARRAGEHVLRDWDFVTGVLAEISARHRDHVAVARTLTQHAVPTTVGLRAAGWLRGAERARLRLDEILRSLPAQLAGAGGTRASFVEIGGIDAVDALVEAFADDLGLLVPDGSWHTGRWPVTELGDALTQVIDAAGVIAADIATLNRTEIGEVAEGLAGVSSAMPQKQNPVGSVLVRSAALRAPYLAATLHTAAALAGDERPDGAWHAEWPALRELLRLALGVSATLNRTLSALVVDAEAVQRNLMHSRGLILTERIGLRVKERLGEAAVSALVTRANEGASLTELLREAGLDEAEVSDLLDPARYTGTAASMVDQAIEDQRKRIAQDKHRGGERGS